MTPTTAAAPIVKTIKYYGDSYTYLANPECATPRRVRGDTMRNSLRQDFEPRVCDVLVTADGRVWDNQPNKLGPVDHAEIIAERWRDGDKLGDTFAADAGEFERCGIVPVLRGELADLQKGA